MTSFEVNYLFEGESASDWEDLAVLVLDVEGCVKLDPTEHHMRSSDAGWNLTTEIPSGS